MKRTETDSADGAKERGIASFRSGQWTAALEHFEGALTSEPTDIVLLNWHARTLEALGRPDEALKAIDRSLALRPRNAADLRNRGLLLQKAGKSSQALASFEAALAVEPNYVDVLLKIAPLLHQHGRRPEALAYSQRAVALAPKNPIALNLRGMILEAMGKTEEALRDFQQALTLDSGFADAINNEGIIHARSGRFNQALECYERSLKLVPQQPHTLYNRAMARLALGDWSRGFREFEHRWAIFPHEAARRSRLSPVWLGECDISGKTLLLQHEQGYGDCLQFCRYVPLVQKRGARVVIAVPAALRTLMGTLSGSPEVVTEGDRVPNYDYSCPLMSLPLVFGTTPETIPAQNPYLHADPEKVRLWRERLGPRRRPRIGIVWSGRRYPPINQPRDVPFTILQALFAVNADFVSLQQELSAEEKAILAKIPSITCYGNVLTDFADTAAVLENLDLLIAVDTAVVHLAGALGRPVWMMNRYASCWRWLQEGTGSPWYPTLRIARQASCGDWTDVIRRVQQALTAFVTQGEETAVPSTAVRNSVIEKREVVPSGLSLSEALAGHQKGQIDAALVAYRQILAASPQNSDARHYLGIALAQQGKYEEAVESLRVVLEAQPRNATAFNHYGNALMGLSHYEQAVAAYDEAIVLNSAWPDPYFHRGVALAAQDRWEAAKSSYEQAIALNPVHAEAYNNLGNALCELGCDAQALYFYDEAIALRAKFVGAWVNRANAFRRLCRYEEALACSDRAIQLNPDHPESHSSRGAALAGVGRHEEALQSYRRAIELNPSLSEGLWNKALAHLSRGEFLEGWPLYEARWKVKALGLTQRFASRSPWRGKSSIKGKTVLLHSEQGYGDTIQFSRYAALIAAEGARVVLGVPSALERLMSTLSGVDQVVANGALPTFDEHCPLLSLPLAFGTELANIPATIPYLRAEPPLCARWRDRLGPRSKPRVGLAWSGRETHSNDANRSIPLERLLPLTDIECDFVSLQKEVKAGDERHLVNARRIRQLGSGLIDFADAAALIWELDLVISVDTAIAHLAGALGKPVWVLLPYVADWRWLQLREDTPWYPTARLFRQPKLGDWTSVVSRAAAELVNFPFDVPDQPESVERHQKPASRPRRRARVTADNHQSM